MCHAVGDNGEKGTCHTESSRVSKRGDPSAFEKGRGHQRGRHNPPGTSPWSIWHSCWPSLCIQQQQQLGSVPNSSAWYLLGYYLLLPRRIPRDLADTDSRKPLLQILHSRHQVGSMIVVGCVARGIARYDSSTGIWHHPQSSESRTGRPLSAWVRRHATRI
jgi:hypothetical protein